MSRRSKPRKFYTFHCGCFSTKTGRCASWFCAIKFEDGLSYLLDNGWRSQQWYDGTVHRYRTKIICPLHKSKLIGTRRASRGKGFTVAGSSQGNRLGRDRREIHKIHTAAYPDIYDLLASAKRPSVASRVP